MTSSTSNSQFGTPGFNLDSLESNHFKLTPFFWQGGNERLIHEVCGETFGS